MSNMIVNVGADEFAVIADYIKNECGVVIGPEKAYLIETRLSKILADCGLDNFGELCAFLNSGQDKTLPERVVNAITTNETLWFRDMSPWDVFRRDTLPRLEQLALEGMRPRVWSAAASTGQEIYSTVMCADDWLNAKHSPVTIADFDFVATDVSSRTVDIAKQGRYDAISVTRGLPEYYKERYFTKTGGAWQLDEKIMGRVEFSKFNLLSDFTALGKFDVIFCRYVLIYFDDLMKALVANKLIDALNMGGELFTGIYVVSQFFRDKLSAKVEGNMTYYVKDDKAVLN